MRRLLKWCCYRTYHVPDVEFDSTTSTLKSKHPLPPGGSLNISMMVLAEGNEPVQVCEVTQTDPRWWFKPFHRRFRRFIEG